MNPSNQLSVTRSGQILRKDLQLGPRSPLFLWALVIPLAMTALIRGVFGELFADEPRLGVVVADTDVVAAADALEGIAATIVDDATAMIADVADGRLDAGVVVDADFIAGVRDGTRPPLEIYISGGSVASDRAVLLVSIIDLVRTIDGSQAPLDVEIVELGDASLPIDLRLLPLLVIYAVAIPGGMVPALSLVEEKERGTIHALLTTPASMTDVLAAKGALGFLLGSIAGLVILTLNNAFGASAVAVTLAVLIGAVMMAQVGCILGAWASDTNTLFAAWKAGGIVLFLPAIFFIWPTLPSWPGQLMPAWYFLYPTWAVAVEGAQLADVVRELAIGLAICALLVPAVVASGRRLERQLVAGRGPAITVEEPADA